ncbi:MAG: hypothetical protein ACRDQF_15145 [Thermocrispum sp.]
MLTLGVFEKSAGELTDAEILAASRVFTEERDTAARAGAAYRAEIFNALLSVLCAERDARRGLVRATEEAVNPVRVVYTEGGTIE